MINGIGFFFSSRRRHTRCGRDWSSDVCSSDLPRKRVNFANIEPETARTIFIQEALVAQQLNSKIGFYQHNIKLLEEVTEYEEKSRRRDLVIDDNWQVSFYTQHLPEKFISQRHLEN